MEDDHTFEWLYLYEDGLVREVMIPSNALIYESTRCNKFKTNRVMINNLLTNVKIDVVIFFEHMSVQTYKMCIEAVRKKGFNPALKQRPKICVLVVRQNGYALRYAHAYKR